MENQAIHLKVPAKMYSELKKLKKQMGFTSVQEVVRDAVRKAIVEYHRQMAIIELRRLKGSAKNVKRLTKADKEKIFREYEKDPDLGRKTFEKWDL